MRVAKTRMSDSTFEINLAPFLDIIVSVVPLLLLSVVFVEIKMIETPVPQVVEQVMEREKQDPDPEVTLNLKVAAKTGFTLEINQKGSTNTVSVPLKDGKLDFEGLHAKASEVKSRFPQVFRLGLAPQGDVPFNDLVRSMDAVRRQTQPDRKVAFVDKTTGQKVETDLMFPNVTFSNVVGE
ncbi:MAG: biopolymer transporter ExbD [Bdellovibrionales bacterium]